MISLPGMILHFQQSWIIFELLRRVHRHAVFTLYLLLKPRVVYAGHLVTHNAHQQNIM